jgi:endonuclease/exonuclease/phosphatase family metal-dependent hydrolase
MRSPLWYDASTLSFQLSLAGTRRPTGEQAAPLHVFAYGGAVLRRVDVVPGSLAANLTQEAKDAATAFVQARVGIPSEVCESSYAHTADILYSDDGVSPTPVLAAEADGASEAGADALGAWYLVRVRCSAFSATGSSNSEHSVTATRGMAGELVITGHTRDGGHNTMPEPTRADADAAAATPGNASELGAASVDAAGEAAPAAADVRPRGDLPGSLPLRVMSYNVWNTNPPRWLWRDPRDRWRQYAFRLYHLADVVRAAAPDIIAFQEVRYDSTLGGGRFKAGANYDFARAGFMAADWYNRTRAFAAGAKYAPRNQAKWNAVTAAPGYDTYGAPHPTEGKAGGGPDASPFARGPGLGPDSQAAVRAAMAARPHAQIAHLAAHLPGYDFVYQPGQVYLDRGLWQSMPHRDEEGPAVFSRYPIVGADYLLLSRNASDEGDGHQRVCLHAIIDVTAAVRPRRSLTHNRAHGGADARVLVDVYTVHLALSEAARNRTVAELLQFVRDSARGSLQVLAGDMNAEPHEPAMAALRAAGVILPGTIEEGEDGADANAPLAHASGSIALGGALPSLVDAWLQRYPEPVPRDADAAVRRYAFTFPSDDPVKRIDLLHLGVRRTGPGGLEASQRVNHGGAMPASDAPESTRAALPPPEPMCEPGATEAPLTVPCVAVDAVWLAGQDAMPGTEGNEGRGLGMVNDKSPAYASDHRAVVADLTLRVPVPQPYL